MLKKPMAAVAMLSALAVPGQGVALSCMKPNMARSFNEKAADDRVWLLVTGQVMADLPLSDLLRLPPPRPGEQPPVQETRTVTAGATFVGEQLGATRTAPLEERVTLEVECFSPWCGSFPPEGVPLLAFLSREADGSLKLPSGICPGAFLERPTPAQIAALRNCLANGECGPEEIAVFE